MKKKYISIFAQNEAGEFVRPKPSQEYLCKWCVDHFPHGMEPTPMQTELQEQIKDKLLMYDWDHYDWDENCDLAFFVDVNPVCDSCRKGPFCFGCGKRIEPS